ncbi:hypothetical protein CANTEDRAFT_119303 [Yamadazyma tenuis ATCC 10573]|uniref:Zn(2)-C6 fungal-type domain-containing protein n=1 Tax=Candida tenuis (strain ATCC 10573 / BCRC 21748 / CBS 615 / JCM 9827 / NBRC 10315 / NRRL Y-1498 / VKM Y-70) TaxID=590646 RepID=G3AZR0_CANTC|nr:uncharacterized protein CANTEDRAFT_119303 [Yamadazyma tenuis ATCC 10573]EGV65216.1 hypothetical protein CANTEDRAFT_119303 [Yamadazyma tenuis ATCC 10573]
MSEQPHSCDFCRFRKLKCSRETPVCSSCIRLGRKCVYTPRAKRVPLTKTYVQQLRDRIHQLESLVYNKNSDTSRSLIACRASEVTSNAREIVKLDELLPFEDFHDVDDLDWAEGDPASNEDTSPFANSTDAGTESNENNLIDGMGALTVGDNLSHSYYGITSTHGILKFLENSGTSESSSKIPHFASYLNENNKLLLKSEKIHILLDNKQHQDEFFNSFFSTYHRCFPVVNESIIRSHYIKSTSVTVTDSLNFKDTVFQVLLNTIFAIGSLMKLGESTIIDLLYYKRVKQWLQKKNILECCNYQLLESFVLLGNYVQKRNKPNTAWNYHGIALRMAITFGLHREIHPNSVDSQYRATVLEKLERRRRLWWCLYYFDIGHCVTFGRPLHTVSLESIDVLLPSNIEDSDLGGDSMIRMDKISKPYPTIYDSLIQEAKLSRVSYAIYSVITKSDTNSIPQIGQKIERYLKLNDLIVDFANSMPEYFKESDEIAVRAIKTLCPISWYEITLNGEIKVPKWFPISRHKTIWRYRNIQILMFRSFIWESNLDELTDSQRTDLERCLDICYEAATYTISSVSSFVTNEELDTHSAWYSTYFLFQAVLVPILFCVREINTQRHDVKQFLDVIELANSSLKNLRKYNMLATRLVETIDTLVIPITHIGGHGQNSTSNDRAQPQMYHSDLRHLSSTAINLFSNIEVDFKKNESQLPTDEYFDNFLTNEASNMQEDLVIPDFLNDELFPEDSTRHGDMFPYVG